MTPEEAIEVIARHAIVRGAYDLVDTHGHEAYPDIGEYDWDRVAEKIAELTPAVDFEEAYNLLSKRANNEDDVDAGPQKKGTAQFEEHPDGTFSMSGFEFDAEGGPMDLNSMVEAAHKALVRLQKES